MKDIFLGTMQLNWTDAAMAAIRLFAAAMMGGMIGLERISVLYVTDIRCPVAFRSFRTHFAVRVGHTFFHMIDICEPVLKMRLHSENGCSLCFMRVFQDCE